MNLFPEPDAASLVRRDDAGMTARRQKSFDAPKNEAPRTITDYFGDAF
jgi:hypothetical protein